MFKEKVLLTIPEQKEVVGKMFGGRKIKIYKTISKEEIKYCIDEAMKIYQSDTFGDNKDMYITPVELLMNIDMLVTQLCTNIDTQNLDISAMCNLGLHDFLKKNITNYSIIEQAMNISVQHIHTMKLLEGIGKFVSTEDIETSETKLKEMLENGVPENVRDLIMAQVVNDPAVAKLFSKLSDFDKKNDDAEKDSTINEEVKNGVHE